MNEKNYLVFLCLIAAVFVYSQSARQFTVVNDDGLTLHFSVLDESEKTVQLVDVDNLDAVTRLVIPNLIKDASGVKYSFTGFSNSNNPLTSLQELILPDNLEQLKWQPFIHLPSMKRIVIPSSLKYHNGIIFQFGLGVVSGVPMEEIYILPTEVPVNTFSDAPFPYPSFNMDLTNVKVFLPTDYSKVYKSRVDWKMNAFGYTPVPYVEKLDIGATGYTSYFLNNENFEVPAGCTAYIVTGVTHDTTAPFYRRAKVKAFGPGKLLPKQTGFILKATPNSTVSYRAYVDGVEEDVTGNLLVGTATGEEFSVSGNRYFVLANGDDGIGFYKQGIRNGTSIKLPAHRAGLCLPSSVSSAKGIIVDFDSTIDGTATEIGSAQTVDTEKNEKLYDLQGRRTEHPSHGIYIVNRKKIVK
ncbi:MAG: hypothetical protein HXL32_05025 [Prevotellaceae bacterium]|nr:hypothetical protein [Prevotellaceae bacterium]